MADEKPSGTGSTTILNDTPATPPAEQTPEAKLFAADKSDVVKPPEPEKKPEENPAEPPKPEEKKEDPKKEPSNPSTEGNKPPVDYENLKLPEGSLLSNDELAAIKKEAKEKGLTLEQAQRAVERTNDYKSFDAAQKEAFSKEREKWKNEWKNDPDFGGDKTVESTELAKRAWNRLADTELKTLADQAGFGDHPAVLRMMARIGKMFSDDTMIRGTVGSPTKPRAPEEILYGGTTKTDGSQS